MSQVLLEEDSQLCLTFAYRPNDKFLLRGGASESFRAPDMHYVYAEAVLALHQLLTIISVMLLVFQPIKLVTIHQLLKVDSKVINYLKKNQVKTIT